MRKDFCNEEDLKQMTHQFYYNIRLISNTLFM